MTACQHLCCSIPWNGYHSHLSTPGQCDRCARALEEGETEALERMRLEVAAISKSVTERMAPEVPTLPRGRQLQQLVVDKAREVYIDGLGDPDLEGLSVSDVRTVLAARVVLRLAFPLPLETH